ncbi:MAG: gamma-glutamyltransferase [Deltaproteobacteria bacterium]|nr:gamma-glutamyltransferase [Deltaproteobacteria bacterium]
MRKFRLIVLVLCVFSSCTKPQKLNLVDPQPGRTLESYQAAAKSAMIASPNPQASQIGLEVLKKGGNAVDAAIAVSFALSVLRPQSTGLGGGGFLLFYDKEKNKTVAIDFREVAPLAAHRDMYLRDDKADTKLSQDGALAVAVPRLVAGLGYLYDNYAGGKISWVDLIQPAINLAEQGFKIYPRLAEAIQQRKEVLTAFPSSKKIFFGKEGPLREGEAFVQKDLAKTLTEIAKQGWQVFYHGGISWSIVNTVRRHGGILDLKDFYHVKIHKMKPVTGTYRDYKIVSMPPPSSGGAVLIEILNILEEFPLRRRGPYNARTAHVITEAMRRGFMDRAVYLGDARFVKVPVRGITSKEYAKSLAASISLKKATPSNSLAPQHGTLNESDSTTHFSIVDQAGNAAASTQTINTLFGSGLAAEGTGIVLNNEMDDFSVQAGVPNSFGLIGSEANAIAPGKVPLSSMSPTFVFDSDGRLFLVLGSPGGPKIITAVLNTILNMIDFKATPLQAVAAKRMHHQWLPDQLMVEPGLYPEEVVEKLTQMGHAVEETPNASLVMLVARTKEGWVGVADPRGAGVPMGY